MPIAICGVHEVPGFADVPLDHIISFHDRDSQPGPNITAFRHPYTLHSFVFSDRGQLTDPEAPTVDHIRRLLDIYATTKSDDRMLFHCLAGGSRSPAAAYIWLVYHGLGYEQAYDHLLQVQPRSRITNEAIRPNPLMISIADHLMNRGGQMLKYVCQRKDDMGYLQSPSASLTF